VTGLRNEIRHAGGMPPVGDPEVCHLTIQKGTFLNFRGFLHAEECPLSLKGWCNHMLELILIRHGETDSNRRGTYLGWTDVHLNEEGIRQAYIAREKLKNEKPDAIYCSPLERTKRTAQIINENYGIEIKYVEDLKERCFGAWEDLTHKEILERYPQEYELWIKDHVNYCVEGGESTIQAYNRVTGFFEKLIKDNSNGTFIIVTHLGCIRKVISYLLGMDLAGSWRFRVDNCSITRIIVNEEKYAYMTLMNG
jgi:alpha-ribazole phosphatase